MKYLSLVLLFFTLTKPDVFAQDNIEPQGLSLKKAGLDDYEKWERLGSLVLSDDGNWIIYGITKNNEENELRLRNAKTAKEDTLLYATGATFSANGKHLAYYIGVSPAEEKTFEKQNESPPKKLALRTLATDSLYVVEQVENFSFNKNGDYIAISLRSDQKNSQYGKELLIRDLSKEEQTSFGNVSDFSWADQGALLAILKETTAKAGNGIQLYNAENSTIKPLDNEPKTYKGLYWRKDSKDLAVFRSEKNNAFEDSTFSLIAWKNLGSADPQVYTFQQDKFPDFHKNKRLLNRSLIWSKDGNSLFFTIKSWTEKPQEKDSTTQEVEENGVKKEAPELQIWHSKDVDIIPNQELARNPREAYTSVWHLNRNTFLQLEDELTEDLRFQRDAPILIGYDKSPYDFEAMFGRPNKDLYAIDIYTGKKHKFLEKINHVYGTSPDGKKVIYLKNDHLHVYDFATKKHTNITKDLPVSFVNKEDDHPVEQKAIYGYNIIGWAMDSKVFYTHSKYDIWELNADGSGGRALTNGRGKEISYRYIRVDYEQEYIDPSQAFFARQYGEWTKQTGYVRFIPGKKTVQLVEGDAQYSRLRKAKHAPALVFTRETFEDSPNIFYSEKGDNKSEKISDTNPFQGEYYWGKSELINYKNEQGQKLQGALFYPANYEPGKKYPMITYIYEKLSQNLHQYTIPSDWNYYNKTVFTHEGYFVLMPDIIFETGNPGISSAKTIEIAVKKATESGMIDKDRIGLVGHSWGGYQAAFVPTQTDIFAAAVSGAGLMNLISMYGTVTRAFGGNLESDHFETSQERMEVNPWQDTDRYLRNSPIMQIERLKTPMLVEIGDNDQNVSWTQGIEFYNAARRLGKQCVLLVYANEGHGLRQDKNRQDYQRRILAWFGHYLKGEDAEPWILEGIPLEEQRKQLENWEK